MHDEVNLETLGIAAAALCRLAGARMPPGGKRISDF